MIRFLAGLALACLISAPALADNVSSAEALNVLNDEVNLNLAGNRSAGFHLAAGTLAATLTPEVFVGAAWVATQFVNPADNTAAATLVLTNPNSATTRSIVVHGGATIVRVRISAFTSGTANGTIVVAGAPGALLVEGVVSGTALPVSIGAGALSVVGGGAEATALRVTVANDSTGLLSVDDNGASLTVDNAQLSVVGGGAEATAMRVTLANDSTGVLSVDDNGAALTVDWAGTAPPIGAGLEATALRVTVATDSTGVVSVDDNGGALTVDWNGTAPPIGAGIAATALRTTLGSDDPAVASLSVMDDWDETNRAAVNPIAGQIGIAGGTGVDAATVPRVSLATNVALPAGTNNIGDVDVEIIGAAVPVGTVASAQTADFTAAAAAANLRLFSWTIRESAASAGAATVVLRHDVTGCDGTEVVALIELAANQSVGMEYGDRGRAIPNGLCVDVLAGTVDFAADTLVEAAP